MGVRNEANLVVKANVMIKQGARLLDSAETHFSEHGIQCTRASHQHLAMHAMDCRVTLQLAGQQPAGQQLEITIETPTENFMVFIRDELVEHLATIEPEAAEGLQWVGATGIGERPANFYILHAVRRAEVFPGLIRVTLKGPDVARLEADGVHIKLMMPLHDGRPPVWPVIAENGAIRWPTGQDKLHARYVTIRQLNVAEQEIDIDIAHHNGGLISAWAADLNDARAVGVMGPGGDQQLPAREHLLLGADLTGLAALARLIEASQPPLKGHLFACAPSQQALEQYLPASQLKVQAISPEHFSERLLECIADIDDTVEYAWFAGEHQSIKQVRALLKSKFCLAKHQRHCVAYWRRGEAGFHP